MNAPRSFPLLLIGALALAACGSDADDVGVAAECTSSDECAQYEDVSLECLADFKGGYCGLVGCQGDADCPAESICVLHDDGVQYCFRTCETKEECNANRSVDNEANCSSSIERVDGGDQKACIPPSGS